MFQYYVVFQNVMLCYVLLCFKSCLPDFSSKSLLVILMCSLLFRSFLPRGSNEISTTVALGHCFLTEIPDSITPLGSSSRGLQSRLFVPERMKIYSILELLKEFNFCSLHIIHVQFYPQLYQNLKCYMIESPISNIFADD